jgi:hypothetical protein
VYNNIGQLVLQRQFASVLGGRLNLDVAEWSAGVYQVIIRSEEILLETSFVKQ